MIPRVYSLVVKDLLETEETYFYIKLLNREDFPELAGPNRLTLRNFSPS